MYHGTPKDYEDIPRCEQCGKENFPESESVFDYYGNEFCSESCKSKYWQEWALWEKLQDARRNGDLSLEEVHERWAMIHIKKENENAS